MDQTKAIQVVTCSIDSCGEDAGSDLPGYDAIDGRMVGVARRCAG